MTINKNISSITYGQVVWDEMMTWFNHTVEDESSFFIRKHEVEDLINFITDLKSQINKLQEELKNGKTDS